MKNPGFAIGTDQPGNHGIRLQGIMRKPGIHREEYQSTSREARGDFAE